jgi:hypothetical protein
MGIPDSYIAATWRNTTPVDPATDEIGIGFDLAGGQAVRLRMGVPMARLLAESVADYLDGLPGGCSQSPISFGMPSVDVSTPEE